MPLPATQANYPISQAVNLLANMVAACTGFANLVAPHTASPIDRVYTRLLTPKPANGKTYSKEEWVRFRPFAFVAIDRDAGFDLRKVAFKSFDDSGALALHFEHNAADLLAEGESLESVDDADLMVRWENIVGSILVRGSSSPDDYQSLADLAHDSGYFAAESFRRLIFWRNTEKEISTKGDFFYAQMTVVWGDV